MKRYALNPSIQNLDSKVSFIDYRISLRFKNKRVRGNYVYVRMPIRHCQMYLSQTINHIMTKGNLIKNYILGDR